MPLEESFDVVSRIVPQTETYFAIPAAAAFPPTIGGINPSLYADFATEGGTNHYWYNGAQYAGFAAWLAAISGTFTRSSTAYYTNSSGNLASVGNDTLRFDYNPVTLASKGILVEGTSTNLCTQSNGFSSATWLKTVSLAQNATGPDGASTAWTATDGVGLASYQIYQASGTITVSSSTTYTLSIFAKAGTINYLQVSSNQEGDWANFNLTTGAVGHSGGAGFVSASSQQFGNGWWRLSITYTTGGASVSDSPLFTLIDTDVNSYNPQYNGTGSGTIYVWGAQFEQLSFVSSYIPTVATSMARSADAMSATPIAVWYNATNGVLYHEIAELGATTSSPGTTITNNVNYNDFTLMATNTGNGHTQAVTILAGGGVGQFQVFNDSVGQVGNQVGVFSKQAISMAANNFIYVRDAGTAFSSASGSMPSGLIKLEIQPSGALVNPHFANIKQVGFWPTTATVAQLQTLTT